MDNTGHVSPPIEHVLRDPQEWAVRFESVRESVHAVLPGAFIEHIGSTAVAGMPAKDVIDALIGVDEDGIESATAALASSGWIVEGTRTGHAWLRDEGTGPRRVVLHVVSYEGREWRERCAFRELLRSDGTARVVYLAVKRRSASQSANWGEYTAGKSATVRWLLTRSPS